MANWSGRVIFQGGCPSWTTDRFSLKTNFAFDRAGFERSWQFSVESTMKLTKTIGVGGAAVLVSGLAFSQIRVAPPGAVKILPPPMFTNSIVVSSNSVAGSNSVPNLEVKSLSEIPFSPPGVYRTEPFSCMVRVPGPMHDDVSMFPQGTPEPPIRIIRPELKAIPLIETNRLK